MHQRHEVYDLIVIGGGIAGLWLHALGRAHGLRSLLLESTALGCGQTLHSQGIIHSGVKYALGFGGSKEAQALARMPARWRACLRGEAHVLDGYRNGNLALSRTRILSDKHYLWACGSANRAFTYLATKMLHSSVKKVTQLAYPAPFAKKTNSSLYQLDELVLDVSSLLEELQHKETTCQLKVTADMLAVEKEQLQLRLNGNRVHARTIVFAAGAGNAELVHGLPDAWQQQLPAMQLRPLHMAALYLPHLPAVFAHATQLLRSKPRLTITTHKNNKQENWWYLGGDLAEKGNAMDSDALVAFAKQELADLLPDLSTQHAVWRSFRLQRAEAKQGKSIKPNSFVLRRHRNVLLAWPTKLALVPALGDAFLKQLPSKQHQTATHLARIKLPLARRATPWYKK